MSEADHKQQAAEKEPEQEPNNRDQAEMAAEEVGEDEEREPTREELIQALEEARAKADANLDQMARARADTENLRKRHEKELENAHKYALDSFIKELLQVWDSMELGMAAAADEATDVIRIREGMELTLKLFGDTMGKFNVERIDPEGEPFNPDMHQAMSMQPRDDVPPNTVVTVIQKGCTLNGRLVRPALVMVSQGA